MVACAVCAVCGSLTGLGGWGGAQGGGHLERREGLLDDELHRTSLRDVVLLLHRPQLPKLLSLTLGEAEDDPVKDLDRDSPPLPQQLEDLLGNALLPAHVICLGVLGSLVRT